MRRAALAALVVTGIVAAPLALVPMTVAQAAGACGPPIVNPVACENTKTGTPPSDWQVSGDGDTSIQGYSTAMSVNVGGTVSFKVKSTASSYHIDILRLGYYQGNGARKVAANIRPSASLPQTQPACLTDASSGLVDCGNWGVSASWAVPADAVSGLYIAHLVRDDTGGSSQIWFVVRDDSSHSDMLVQASDTTWEAYNTYGGNSLYTCGGGCPVGNPQGYKAAYKVSYNRPFTPSADVGRANPYYAEFPMIRFLEANGYDLSYTTGGDVDRSASLLLNHKVFVSSGHDEYWSGTQRANVEAARDAGVSLAFFSGNEVFWKTRWEASIDGSNTPRRTLVTYKETHFNAVVDPQGPATWTGTWRDPRFSPPGDGGRPENALTGQYFSVNAGTADIKVPAANGKLRLWRNTAAATLGTGQTLTLGSGIGTLGYEWDLDIDNGFRPAGLLDLSTTTVDVPQAFTRDYGTDVYPATLTHHLTLYRAPSGALVFGSGTVQWAWGLDSTNPNGGAPDRNMQQATVNLFADMGAQPFSLQSGLVAASKTTDTTAPTSVITSPAANANLVDGNQVTVTGTAADTGGGTVAGVEVSTDGGTTWHPADGTTSWSYSWIVRGSPTSRVMSRAVDDSGNLESPAAGNVVNVACPCSVFGTSTPAIADAGDNASVVLGMKFTTDVFGTVSGMRFYKAATNTGTHVGTLWTSTGQQLASATFTGESASGWQTVSFSPPVVIGPNTTYVVSYIAPKGHYSDDVNYFYPPPAPNGFGVVDSAPLHAVRQTGGNINGVFSYSATNVFPTSADFGDNYWVDAIFTPSAPPGAPTNVTATAGYSSAGVSWTATGGPASSYTVTPFIGSTAQPSTTITGVPAPTATTISGLTNGVTYTFVVTPGSPAGAGPPSGASNAVTPSATASVVINGGFEGGLPPWTAGAVTKPTVTSTRAHSGTSSAVLGIVSGQEPSGDSTLSQTLTVPPGTSTLSFWYWPVTVDGTCSGTCPFDYEEAQIRSTGGATLASIFKSNSNGSGWTQVNFNTSAYAGQTIVLYFNVHSDGSSPPDDSSMYLDDVTLNGAGGLTAPAAPTGVTAAAGNAQATVSWTAPANGGSAITSYTVTPFIGTTAQTPTTVTGSPPATTATVTGLTNGTAYTFVATATNAVGTGPASAASSAVTPTGPTVPAAPTGVTAVAGNAQATVSWTAPANGGSAITSYTVTPFIGTTAQTPTTVSGSPPAISVTVTGLLNGSTHTFTVTATNAIGTGPVSAPSNAVIPIAPTAPSAPSSVTATAGNAQATVSWSAPANSGSAITSYTVRPFIGTTAQTSTTVSGSPPATSVVVTGLTNGTAYTFTVTATNGIGTGPASAASSAVTPTGPMAPSAPTGVTAAAGIGAATVSWSAPANNGSAITSYTVTPFIGTTAQTPATVSGSPPATSVTVSGLTNGTAYTFTVTATNGIGTGPASAASNAVTPTAPTAPSAPTAVTATGGNGSATISWVAPANGGSAITSYTVTPFIGTTAQTPTTVTGSPPNTLVTRTGLTNGTTYTFTVAATNAVGTSAPSTASNAVTPAATVTPPAFVQQTSAQSGFTTALPLTPPSNITTGNRLVVMVGVWSSSRATAQTVTDAAGNVYTKLLSFAAADDTEMSVWSAPITAGGGTRPVVTVTPTSGADVGATVVEYSGLSSAAGAAVVDQLDSASGHTSAAATVASGATSPTNAGNELAVGFYADSGFGTALTAGAGFTQRVNMSPNANMDLLVQDQVVGQGATPSSQVGTGANTDWLAATVVLKSGAAVPPTAPSAPTGVTASAGNGSALVSWVAPPNGGSAITSYTVTPFAGTTALTPTTVAGSPPGTTVSVTGLTNGTAYTFTVTATNAVGTSPASAASNAVTPSASVAAPAFVQQISAQNGRTSGLTLRPAANVVAGNRLVVLVGVWNSSGATASAVTDTAGNTYTELMHFAAADKTEMSVWSAPITLGGGTRPTLTVSQTSAADVGATVLEYKGLSSAAGAGIVDQKVSASGRTSAAATVASGATAATTAGNELALGFYVDSGFGTLLTAGSGFTQRVNLSPNANMDLLVEDQAAGAGATPNARFGTGANTDWLAATVVLKGQ